MKPACVVLKAVSEMMVMSGEGGKFLPIGGGTTTGDGGGWSQEESNEDDIFSIWPTEENEKFLR